MKLIKNIDLKKKILFGLSFNFFVLFLIIYFIIIPYKDIILKTKSKIISGRVALQTRLILEQKNSKISQKINTVKPDLKIIDGVFITEGDELNFITSLENLAEINNLKLNITLGLDNKDKKTSSLPLKLTLNGNYNNVMNFIGGLENLRYYINILDLDLSNTSEQANSSRKNSATINTNTKLNINALAYWQ